MIDPYVKDKAIRAMKEALEYVVEHDTFWTSRDCVGSHTVVVEDDGKHDRVRILGRCGARARTVLSDFAVCEAGDSMNAMR